MGKSRDLWIQGFKKSTAYAATIAAEKAAQAAIAMGLSSVDVQVKGPGLVESLLLEHWQWVDYKLQV